MDIKKAAVVGAGVMGGEIAQVVAAAGIPVALKDIESGALEAGMEKARSIFDFKVRRRRMTREQADAGMALIEPTLEFDPLREADIVIEAAPESLEIKKEVMNALHYVCPDHAIFVSNTSALSIRDIASRSGRADRVAGMHFFNPASLMSLVEVVAGPETSADTIQTVRAFAERIKKRPVIVRDSAGFVVNRLLCAAFLQAVKMRDSGEAAMEVIDRCLTSPEAGLPVGLFKMGDQLGLDLLKKVIEILHGAFGERFRPPDALIRLCGEGKFGVKTGAGFYVYDGAASPGADAGQIPGEEKEKIIFSILGAVYREALRMEKEGVATREAIDEAMRLGALFKKPPFAFAASVDPARLQRPADEGDA